MTNKKTLIYDGTCNVCIASKNSVEKRDKNEKFELVDAHSETGKRLSAQHGLDTEKSAYVIEGDSVYEKSDMALHVLENLGWFEKFVAHVGRLVPKKAADSVYSFISKRRKFFNH